MKGPPERNNRGLTRLLRRIYACLLFAFPGKFRRRFGREMRHSFGERLRAARHRAGRRGEAAYAWASFRDALKAGLLERWEGWVESKRPASPALKEANPMKTLPQDIHAAARGLWRHPGYSLTVVLLLALGIAANAAIFSVAYSVLWKPLPFPDSGRLVRLWMTRPAKGFDRVIFSRPDYQDFREQNSVFQELAASLDILARDWTYQAPDGPVRVEGCYVSASFFSVLGTKALLGRPFLPREDTLKGGKAVVLSHRLWSSLFNSDPEVVGGTIRLNGDAYQVVGVMPADFALPEWAGMWAPIGPILSPKILPQARGVRYLHVYGRLKPGVSLRRAQAEVEGIAGRLARRYPESNEGSSARVEPLRESLAGDSRTPLMILQGAVAFLLLIACANAAGLLLVRAASRRREFALRSAMGAGRFRLLSQLLGESALLTLAAGAIGLAAAWAASRGIILLASDKLPRLHEVGLHWPVMLFSLALACLVALLTGLAPALRLSASDPGRSLAESGRWSSGGTASVRARSLLVVAQVALALVLVTGAGLLTRSLMELHEVDPGFSPKDVLTAQIQVSKEEYRTAEAIRNLARRLQSEALQMAGVESAAISTALPLVATGQESVPFAHPDDPPEKLRDGLAGALTFVSAGYFQTLGIDLVQGRDFRESDAKRRPPPAIVSRGLAERLWPGEDPLAREVLTPIGRMPVIGVAEEVRFRSLASRPRPHIYAQFGPQVRLAFKLNLRVKGRPLGMIGPLREKISQIDPRIPAEISSLEQIVSDSLREPRFNLQLLGLFSALALGLAVIGLYATLAYAVRHRRREMGIRQALGADRSDLLGLVLRQGMLLVAAGAVLGLGASYGLSRLIQSMLYGVGPADPLAMASAVAVVVLVSLAACALPARHAARVEAATVLREE